MHDRQPACDCAPSLATVVASAIMAAPPLSLLVPERLQPAWRALSSSAPLAGAAPQKPAFIRSGCSADLEIAATLGHRVVAWSWPEASKLQGYTSTLQTGYQHSVCTA